ncbi:acyl-CoA N-acyltransferase [Periconia macrospinosa]|uniref:Acyl-CoA N-acyltransferase n=1 Tax=Periconia macrospinosa TaxID=97972 RepID=A0A2V1DY32_9PLEO|nr:acyl-CoA N-acyltransferase [Periconia macrospinosa]
MSNNNNLEVSLLTPEEADRYMRIRHGAFKSDINKVFYLNAPQSEPAQSSLDIFTASVIDGIKNKGIIFTKCVDKSTSTIIAGSRWTYHKPSDPTATTRTPQDLDNDYTTPDPYPESNLEVWNAFFDLFHATKREVMGLKRFWKLDTLVTDPAHHRRGAGRLLLEEGLRRVDEEGVECYLESSQVGRPLYEKFGFEPVKDISLDLRRWGGDEEIVWTIMRRPAKGQA